MGRLKLFTKFSLILMKVSANFLHFIIFSSSLRNIFLTILDEESDAFYFNNNLF